MQPIAFAKDKVNGVGYYRRCRQGFRPKRPASHFEKLALQVELSKP